MIKNSIKYAAILFLVSAISTFIVASVHEVVSPIIVERTAQKVKDNLNSIYAGSPFDYRDISDSIGMKDNEDFDKLYEIKLKDNKLNYVYQMSPMGRNAEIHYLIAYDTNGAVLKIQYVQMRETKGRGDKITKNNYLDKIYSQNASNINIETITGATYSTKAMKQSIEATAYHLLNEVLK